MRMTEKIERFFNLDEEEKEILKKASYILCDMAENVDGLGKISLTYENFTEPFAKTRSYDEGNLYDFSYLLAVLSKAETIEID